MRLTFYFQTRYDESLAQAVTAQTAAFAGIAQRSRMIPLRWVFPDAFFHFQDTGQLSFTLEALDFPLNELNPQIRMVGLLVSTEEGTNPALWNIRLGVPHHPATIAASPNAQGEVASGAGHAWQPLASGDALGNYLVEISAGENPGLVTNGVLQLNAIQNIVLILEYEFTPRI